MIYLFFFSIDENCDALLESKDTELAAKDDIIAQKNDEIRVLNDLVASLLVCNQDPNNESCPSQDVIDSLLRKI